MSTLKELISPFQHQVINILQVILAGLFIRIIVLVSVNAPSVLFTTITRCIRITVRRSDLRQNDRMPLAQSVTVYWL